MVTFKCLERLGALLEKFKDETKIVYIGGDFNTSLLQYASVGLFSQFVELFL